MPEGPHIANIAVLIGDPVRAEILTALMAGRALTATELADAAGVTRQTASGHLARLLDAGMLAVEPQGRHRYFRLADHDVAHLLESLMGVAWRTGSLRQRSAPRDPALRHARICYDHLAGELGVHVFDSLCTRHAFTLGSESLDLSAHGRAVFKDLGIDAEAMRTRRRHFCRTCLDWSERRHHLAGALGAALLARMLELGWAVRETDSRIVRFSVRGERMLLEAFPLDVDRIERSNRATAG